MAPAWVAQAWSQCGARENNDVAESSRKAIKRTFLQLGLDEWAGIGVVAPQLEHYYGRT